MLDFFPHIPKTGGSTLRVAFFEAFGKKGLIRVGDPANGMDVSPEGFKDLPIERFDGVSAVIGHMPVRHFVANHYVNNQMNEGKVRILTSVRNPVDRLISQYNYAIYFPKAPRHEDLKRRTILDFVMKAPHNFQFGYLESNKTSTVEEILSRIDVFPIENSILGYSRFFEANHNFKIKQLEIANSSAGLAKGQRLFTTRDIPGDKLEELISNHSLDFELYKRSGSSQSDAKD